MLMTILDKDVGLNSRVLPGHVSMATSPSSADRILGFDKMYIPVDIHTMHISVVSPSCRPSQPPPPGHRFPPSAPPSHGSPLGIPTNIPRLL